MNDYEELVSEIAAEYPIIETDLSMFDSEGFYRRGKIFIEKNISTMRKKERLGEEYGHAKTSVGDILNQKSPEARKQEVRARAYGYEKVISLDDFVDVYEAGITDFYSAAETLGVSVEYLKYTLAHYFRKYGTSILHRNYIIGLNDDFITMIKLSGIYE